MDILDFFTDNAAYFGLNSSVGLAQVMMSTAEFVEDQGYVTEQMLKDMGYSEGFAESKFFDSETKARYARLNDDKTSALYAAAYIKYFQDLWADEYPEIADHPEILGTLYNLGHDNTEPKKDPKTSPFGDYVAENYDLMGGLLGVD